MEQKASTCLTMMYHSGIIAESFGIFVVWCDKAEVASMSTTEVTLSGLAHAGG